MNFRELRYFIAVYEELSFSAAAKRCFVAQPSISLAIQQLEEELKCQLFVRHVKGVTPTLKGGNLYPYACRVVANLESIKTLFNGNIPKLSLSLSVMPFLSGKRVSLIIKTLFDSVPNLDLTVVDLNASADVRIIAATQVRQGEVFKRLWTDNYMLAMPKGNPLALNPSVALKQLDGVAFVSRQPCDIEDSWRFVLQQQGVSLDTKATVKNEEYALDFVSAGLGVSIVPGVTTVGRNDIVTRPICGLTLERVVGMAYESNRPLPPEFLKAIESAKG